MSILIALHHLTRYEYDRLIKLGPQLIRLRPAPHSRSTIRSYSLKVTPEEHFINWQQDPFGNYLARIVAPKKTRKFQVEIDIVMEIRVFNPLDFFLEEGFEHYPFEYSPELKAELLPYLEIKESGIKLKEWVKEFRDTKGTIISFLSSCNQKLHETLNYGIRLEPGIQSCEETLTLKSGSCRDMAWLLCQLLRHCGLATRFASGYLVQLKQDIPSLDGPSGVDEDFGDLHAWAEVYLPGAGWVGLDPTSGLFSGEGHIPLSCSPNPSTAAPITGRLDECESVLSHELKITRIHEDPRITRPISDESWQKVLALGEKVDSDLKSNDVRLTMGGEPTFVSLDDPQGDEWNFTALSQAKTLLGDKLLWRLKEKLSTGAVVQYSQGKWYPNELLPRWAMNCFYRVDGLPVWQDPQWLARSDQNCGHDLSTAHTFLAELAENLGIADSYILTAQEDAPYYLWKEARLPIEDEIYSSDLFEEKERQRLQRLLDGDLNHPAGYVLPLSFSHREQQWVSNAWLFRNGRLVLVPGDSPIGLRLPLASLPSSETEELAPERSPLEKLSSLPSIKELEEQYGKDSGKPEVFAKYSNGMVRTALCAEVRNGTLHLFLPPLSYIEHFLALLCAIEGTAKNQGVAIVLEGYAPPHDLRIKHFSVTPDPGVLEVNLPPVSTWKELISLTETLYDEARQTRLLTEKFLLDGRLAGTGGGNHIVVGGVHPLDSPFLRRPSLLRSMVTFWQHHPSLSYLFSAQYIGPTSQAPRIDEARHDSLYELEIAFQQLDLDADEKVPLWLVDRLFRNVLVDLTGNTHRAEFCIDKLYSPDSNRGRLGLLELRGFEMTPHARMNLLQALLVRAVISSFWKKPYEHSLFRWGTRLHDEFMLPDCIWSDFLLVLETLRKEGYDFDPKWFDSFMEFRFPKLGSVTHEGVTIELRYALEPWPILGEELFHGGVSRAVDSSVERLQVKVKGIIEPRHIVTCNGYPLSLQETNERGVYIGGVRYKAWAPCSSMHPNIPVHSPLVFDVVDTVQNRSLGACKYHVMHQGGRNYENYPVNANEAEGRRLARFEEMGHTQGKMQIKKVVKHPDFPYTLDLRYQCEETSDEKQSINEYCLSID
ncbi:MAG: IMP dehydrogenase [Waddliaceae bacterium]|nr:IMP dehydrogenase [Waddliaceae bacterium]